jgi:two-component SAPR family response regulator
MKPTNVKRLEEEINFALLQRNAINEAVAGIAEKKDVPHIMVRTFGNFDVLVDGEIVSFSRSKSKELLAYLVDRQGGSVTRAEAFALLWEDGMYDRSMQKQLDVIIRALKSTLEKYEISEILELQRGSMRLVVDKVECDLYRLLAGDISAINSYRGEYMSAYEWASLTEGYVTRNLSD